MSIIFPGDWLCVTQRQPWASLIAVGEKQVITRTQQPPIGPRGVPREDFPIAIVASGSEDQRAYLSHYKWPYVREAMQHHKLERPLPQGIVATAWMTCSIRASLCKGITTKERKFGTYTPEMWAWFLIEISPLETPIKMLAEHGVWVPPFDVGLRLTAHHQVARVKGRHAYGQQTGQDERDRTHP
jgi:hypothetical protein